MLRKALPYIVAAAVVAAIAFIMLMKWGGPRPAPLTEEMKRDLGAAALVPEQVSVYASQTHIAESCKQLWESNAVQSLAALPLVQQAWASLQHHPVYLGVLQAAKTEPVLVQLLPVLEDAVSSEVFAATGPELPEFIEAFARVSNAMRMMWLQAVLGGAQMSRRVPSAAELVDAVVANERHLQVPSIMLGFKLARPDAAAKFLDEWIPKIGPTPVGVIQKKSVNGSAVYALEVHGETVFRNPLRTIESDLTHGGVPADKARRFAGWLAGLQVKLAIGVRGDYLLLSLGREMTLLEQWGRGTSLAQSAGLDPVRKHLKPGLRGVSYSSARMAQVVLPSPADIKSAAASLAAAIPDAGRTKGLKDRLLKDVAAFVGDIPFPKASSTCSLAFANKGIETLTFGGPANGGLDYSQPLTILKHRGKKPILFAAGRSAKDPGAYDKLAKWLKVLYGYVEDYAIPGLEPADRKQYDTAMALVKPLLASLDEANRACLVPALDGAQFLVVLDGEGQLGVFPGGTKPPKPIPLPRLALAVELNDPKKFTEGIERYAVAIRKAIEDARKAYPSQIPPQITIPPPLVAETSAGTLYTYKLPWDLGQDAFPCALLKDRLLVLASSSALAREMAEGVAMPACPVTSMDGPAGAATGADVAQLSDFLRRGTDAIFAALEADEAISPRERPQAMLVKMHLDALWRSLGALRTYSSTATVRDGRVVNHSWLHVEDVPK